MTGNKGFASVDSNVPSPADMCWALLVDHDKFGYLVHIIRTIEDSGFSEADAVHVHQSVGAK